MTTRTEEAIGWITRADALAASGNSEGAADAYAKAVALDPGQRAAWFGLSTELQIQRRVDAALDVVARALAEHPEDPPLLGRLGDALQMAGRLDEARDAYHAALALDDKIAHACYGLGCVELAAQDYRAAKTHLERAARLRPRAAEAHFNLATALFNLGEIDGAVAQLETVVGLGDARVTGEALAGIARIIPGAPGADNARVLAARRRWAESVRPKRLPTRAAAPPDGRKLRVGYVSSFFHGRGWMRPVWALINNHDRGAFEIHLFSDSADPASGSGYRDHATDYWHLVRDAGNEELARHIAALGIDILVDLNGYSAQERLPLFMMRPAPVQVIWFNMYGPSGLDGAYDRLVADDAVLPREEEAFYGERVVRLAAPYLTFSVEYDVPAVVAPPALANGFLTFGCLGSHYKLAPEVIAAFATILHGARTARLLLKNRILGVEANREAVRERFAAHGIAPERLLLEGPEEHEAFLAAYGRVDVALDTFPYNGGTTTVEALWQGVPVLTFEGDRWAARTSRSILVGAGLTDWIAPSLAAFVERGIALARDPATPATLAASRRDMRRRLQAAPICDAAGYCRAMEQFYRDIAAESFRHPREGGGP